MIIEALWAPSWYGLDQNLSQGETGTFWLQLPPEVPRALFWSELRCSGEAMPHRAQIVAIQHSTLGAIHRVTAKGLSYLFTLASGQTLQVDSEQEPGQVESPDDFQSPPSDWTLTVTVELLDDPAASAV